MEIFEISMEKTIISREILKIPTEKMIISMQNRSKLQTSEAISKICGDVLSSNFSWRSAKEKPTKVGTQNA